MERSKVAQSELKMAGNSEIRWAEKSDYSLVVQRAVCWVVMSVKYLAAKLVILLVGYLEPQMVVPLELLTAVMTEHLLVVKMERCSVGLLVL